MTAGKTEVRFGQELRAASTSKAKTLQGLAAVFNAETEIYEPSTGMQYREQIQPGAFKSCLNAGTDIRFLYNHDKSKVLARRSAGNLQLKETAEGLQFVATLPNTSDANDLWENVRAGNVTGNSFGFYIQDDAWTEGRNGQLPLRTLKEIHCYEISSCPFPAYEQTSVTARNMFPDGTPSSVLEARAAGIFTTPSVAVDERELARARARLELAIRRVS